MTDKVWYVRACASDRRDTRRLPGDVDGLALARTVNSRYPRIPIVLTTRYAKIFDTEPEFPALRKPYQLAAFGRSMRDAPDSAKVPRAAAVSR